MGFSFCKHFPLLAQVRNACAVDPILKEMAGWQKRNARSRL